MGFEGSGFQSSGLGFGASRIEDVRAPDFLLDCRSPGFWFEGLVYQPRRCHVAKNPNSS